MCFSEDASIVSFNVGLIGSLLCVSLGTITDRIIGYFFAFVSLMQGVEYLLWRHQICDDYNKILSMIGMILNHLQPLVFGIIILLLNPKVRHKNVILIVMLLYLCIIIPYSAQYVNDKNNQCTLKNEKTHLLWNWNYMEWYNLIYAVFDFALVTLSLLGLPKLNVWFALIMFVSYVHSRIKYANAAGALWCYYAVFLPIVYFVLRVTLIRRL